MSELQQIARKLARSWCYVSVHFDATLPKIGSNADCAVCDSRECEILAALQQAAERERRACAEIVSASHALLEKSGVLTVVGVSVILADKTRAILARGT